MPRNLVPSILARVQGTMCRHHMIEPRDHVGVAVSGGIDSVVLLDILANLRDQLHITLMVLHLNHGIRGAEAARDERFVQDLSARYDLPYCGTEADVPAYRKENALSLQEAARELRYRFFKQAIQTYDLDKVVIGQSADDQAETVLMRLIKGGGARGLKGIPPVRGAYIRPLIEVWREEIARYAEHKGLSFVQDSSNSNEHYLRNRIRRTLLPALQGYNPSIKKRLLHLAQVLGEDAGYLEGLAAEVAAGIIMTQGEEVVIPIPSLLALPAALQARVLQRAFTQVSSGGVLEFSHIQGIRELIQEGGGTKEMALPQGYTATRSYERLMVGKTVTSLQEKEGETELVIPGRTRLAGMGVEIEATIAHGRTDPQADPHAAYLDYQHVVLPLHARSFAPGDTFVPLGMHTSKKLKHFFIDLKIPRAERWKIPLIISGRDICWVAGLRIDDRFKINDGTTKILRLAMKRL